MRARSIEFWMLLFGVWSRNFRERMLRHSEQTDFRATSTLYYVPTNLFVMKSRRERKPVLDLLRSNTASQTIGRPAVRRRLYHFWMHSGKSLLNNTKRPHQTNIASGFYRRHPWRLSRFIYAVRKVALSRERAVPLSSTRREAARWSAAR